MEFDTLMRKSDEPFAHGPFVMTSLLRRGTYAICITRDYHPPRDAIVPIALGRELISAILIEASPYPVHRTSKEARSMRNREVNVR